MSVQTASYSFPNLKIYLYIFKFLECSYVHRNSVQMVRHWIKLFNVVAFYKGARATSCRLEAGTKTEVWFAVKCLPHRHEITGD